MTNNRLDPAALQPGTYTLEYTLSDGFGTPSTATLPVVIRGENRSLHVNQTADADNHNDYQTSLREAVQFANVVPAATDFSVHEWMFNGSAFSQGDTLTLTTNQQGQAGSAWMQETVNVRDFTASFTYNQDRGADGADGFTITMHGNDLNAVGSSGGGLGYAGIGNSIALAFNIYADATPGFAMLLNGNVSGGYTPLGGGISLTNGQPIDITVRGTINNLLLTLTQGSNTWTTSTPGAANFTGSAAAYFGFTGATGAGTARQTINNLNVQSQPLTRTVTFDSALAGQTFVLSQGWNAATDHSAFAIDGDVAIDGGDAGLTFVIDDATDRRHFTVNGGGNLRLDRLNLTGGFGDFGGSIWNHGSFFASNSAFFGNHATQEGGAIQSWGGSTSLYLNNVTLAGNTSDSTASALGTGAATSGLEHVTIVDNTAAPGGGSLLIYQTDLYVGNSIIARNVNDGVVVNGDGSGKLRFNSHDNLLGIGNWPNVTDGQNGNRLQVASGDLMMTTLGEFGGPTPTLALLPGSLAIDAAAGGAAIDQRGIARNFGDAPDIGAFESRGFNLTKLAGDNQSATLGSAFSDIVVGVTSDFGEPVDGGRITLTGPASGASISPNPIAATIANGQASFAATAGDIDGSYEVTATANGVEIGVSFSLTNVAGDVIAPIVTDGHFEFETPHAIAFTFSEDVTASLDRNELIVVNTTTNETIPVDALGWDGNTAWFVFAGLLPNGNYVATLPAGSVEDAAGNVLESDVNFGFFVLAGDANRDRKVDLSDFAILRNNFGTDSTFSQGDFNYDGRVDLADFAMLRASFGNTLPGSDDDDGLF